jgi:hypothetical protein
MLAFQIIDTQNKQTLNFLANEIMKKIDQTREGSTPLLEEVANKQNSFRGLPSVKILSAVGKCNYVRSS